MFVPSYQQLQSVFATKNYVFYTDDWKLNVVGIRTSYVCTNKFDDTLLLAYRDANVAKIWSVEATTDPGKGPMENPLPKGRAILKPDQYKDTYRIDLHLGKYEALCQRLRPVTVYRDVNGDLNLDKVNEDTGMFGINIHWSSRKPGVSSIQVDRWSEGCQVGTGGGEKYDEFMAMCHRHAALYGNIFTYTLLDIGDFR